MHDAPLKLTHPKMPLTFTERLVIWGLCILLLLDVLGPWLNMEYLAAHPEHTEHTALMSLLVLFGPWVCTMLIGFMAALWLNASARPAACE